MAKRRVPLHQNPRGFVEVDPEATKGAQLGVNLLDEQGRLLTRESLAGTNPSGPNSIASTIWRLIREVPLNIQKLAALATSGFAVRRSDGEWSTRTLQQGAGITISNPAGEAGDPEIGLADVTDSGVGVLLATTFDAKGRKTGSRPATITGTATQINVANGTAAAGLPTLSLAAEVLTSLGKADSALQPGAAHNTALSGLQGGSTSERYHATAAQNASLTALAVSAYIDGMQMGYVSGSSLSFSSGSLAIQSTGLILQFPATITKSGISLAANSWGHCYAFSNAGVPDVEVVTTAPAAPYMGTARAKTGDSSRRYLGSVRTDASGSIIPFGHKVQGGEVKYRNSVAANQILSSGMSGAPANVDASSRVPVTSTLAEIFAETGPGDVAFISNPDVNADPIAGVLFFLRASQQIYGTMETSSTQQLNYALTPAVSGLSIYCCGYTYAR